MKVSIFSSRRSLLDVALPLADSRTVFELPQDAFEKINSLDRNHRYNLPARLGVDIFGDAKPEVLEKAVAEFKKKNRQARGLEA